MQRGGFFTSTNAWYEVHVTPTRDGLTGFFRNISPQKLQDATLKSAGEHIKAILDELPAMVWAAQPNGLFDYTNRQWQEFTGVKLADISQLRVAWANHLRPVQI